MITSRGAVSCAAYLRSLIPSWFQPFCRCVYHRFFRIHLRLRCWYADLTEPNQALGFAMPPALLRFRVSEQLSRDVFLRIGEGCARLIDENARNAGVELARCRRVLDFGCGCGRTLLWLMHRYPEVTFDGADVDGDAIEWCQRHLDRGKFTKTQRKPPLPYPDEYFDLVYSFSVFTHLDEEMQDRWLAELKRVTRCDGLLLFTVHGIQAARVLDEIERARLDAAGFLFKTSSKLKGIVPAWYHTAWHSEPYIVARVSRWFADVRYTVISDGLQDIVTARRG